MCTNQDYFNWLIDQYIQFKQEKKFAGAPIDLLKALYQHMKMENKMVIFIAKYNNQPVAGIIIVRHGLSCTYLLGWTGEIGRNLNAHKFLLWEAIKAIKAMKAKGLNVFDLGGVFSNEHKDFSHFKNGLNGKNIS